MRSKPIETNRGFTLLETIVAVILISIGLLMTAHLMVVAIEMHEATESDIKGIQLAQAKLEILKAQFSQSILGGDTPMELTEGTHGPESLWIQTAGDNTQSHLYYDVTWDVVNLAGGKKQVTLTVKPTNAQYDPASTEYEDTVSIATILSP